MKQSYILNSRYTKFEREQLKSGSKIIRRSSGVIITPILLRANPIPKEDRENHTFVPHNFSFFMKQLRLLIGINCDPNFFDKSDIESFTKSIFWFYSVNYLGGAYLTKRDEDLVCSVVNEEFERLEKIGHNKYVNNLKNIYPDCIVGKKARYRCVDKSIKGRNARRISCLNARTETKLSIFISCIHYALSKKNPYSYFLPDGRMKPKFKELLNKRLIGAGFNPIKRQAICDYCQRAVSYLGKTIGDMLEDLDIPVDEVYDLLKRTYLFAVRTLKRLHSYVSNYVHDDYQLCDMEDFAYY